MNTEPERRPRWPLWKILAIAHGPVLAVLVALVVLEPYTGAPLANIIRDTVQVVGVPEHVGALSNVGALLWCTAAVVCFFGSAVLRRAGAATAKLLFWSGVLTTLLLIDDLFLIHDGIIARELHIGDKKAYAFYLLSVAVYLYAFGRALLAREPQLLVLAFALFGVSIVTDLLWPEPRTLRYLLEDGSKLLGIVTWATMFVRIAYAELSSVVQRPAQ